VSFFWVLAGILGSVCADGLISGGVCGDGGGWSFFWAVMGSGSLLGGGVDVSLVGCCSGRFSKGDGEDGDSFVGCFSGRFSKSEGESVITCEGLVWDGSFAWKFWIWMESLPAWCLEELAELLWSSSRWPWLLANRVPNISICFVRM
jgi:hypothetical protein